MREEPLADDDDRELAAARLRGRRVVLGLVTVVSLAFVASSTGQIAGAVFGFGFEPLPAGASAGSPEQLCASGIQGLVRALDRAGGRQSSGAAGASDETTASRLSPEWDRAEEVRVACDAAQGGPSAWASLQRLRVAEAQPGRLGREELSSVRNDVAAHLPADLR